MKVIVAKAQRARAELATLEAVLADDPAPFSDDELRDLRDAIEVAALRARTAGAPVDDIVGSRVGRLET